jgi:TonB family protein
VNGHEVLLTEQLGPAVAGAGRPVILLPRWVLALDARSCELLLAHEFEHVKQGDTRLLLTGAVITALMPWNPVAWWISRRLRLAVEQDCDARVLKTHPDVRRYADLLLMAAGRPGVSTLLAAHFGEHRSDLDRRIQAMTDRTFRWRPTLVAATIAGVLLVASCEAPRPEPLAPRDGETALPNAAGEGGVFYEFQVEKPVTQAVGSVTPKYPDILRQAGVEGEALVSFVVNEDGTAEGESFKVIRTSHELFAAAIRQALPAMKFVPAEVAGRKVKQLVQQPFSFSLPGLKSSQPNSGDARATGSGSNLPVPSIILRDAKVRASGSSPLIIVDGVIMTGSLNDIEPASISSIEVVKGAAAVRLYGPRAKDGVIQITTKSGRRGAVK